MNDTCEGIYLLHAHHLIMAALCNMASHYIFVLRFLLLSICLSSIYFIFCFRA